MQTLWLCLLTKSDLLRFRHSSEHVLSKTKSVTPHFLTFLKSQGSKLKKSLGRLLATNWRNIVAKCKFSVANFYNQNNVQVPLVESV